MFLIVGLGNPGIIHRKDRHNFGFLAVDEISSYNNLNPCSDKFKSKVFTGTVVDTKVLAIKPQKYMNLSGDVVQRFVSFYKIPLTNIIVIHDDIDIDLGKVRVKIGGGSGGHNGLKNIDNLIGSSYTRVRLGVWKR